MRCKQGDLAIVVYSFNNNEGRILKCLRFAGSVDGLMGDDYWATDTPLKSVKGKAYSYYRDAWLRPIRRPPDDAKDETLLWRPVPTIEEKEYVYAEK